MLDVVGPKKVNFGLRVTSISENKGDSSLIVTGVKKGRIPFGGGGPSVTGDDPSVTEYIPFKKSYHAVISTTSLSCLGTIDLSGCDIAGNNYPQWSAIRELQYRPAVKLGINFKENWWGKRFGIVGGQSYTDLPIRCMWGQLNAHKTLY